MNRLLPAMPLSIVTFVAILLLSAAAVRVGILSDDAVTLWANAITAGDGETSIGRIVSAYPTIPFLATSLMELLAPVGTPTPALIAAVLIGLLAGLWFLAMRDNGIGAITAFVAAVLLASHPAILRGIIAGPADVFLVAFLALLAKGLYDLRATSAAPDVMTVALALLGLCFSHPMGAAIAIGSMPFLAMAVRPAVAAKSGINMVVALVFPAIFCVGSFVYVSWVFPGSGWSFLTNPSTSLATWAAEFPRLVAYELSGALAVGAGVMVAASIVLGAPAAVAALVRIRRRRPLAAPAMVLFCAVVMAGVMTVAAGVFGSPASLSIAAPVLAAVAMTRIPAIRERLPALLTLLVLGWVGGAASVTILDPRFVNDMIAMTGARGDQNRLAALDLGYATAAYDGVLVDTFNAPAVVLGRGRARGLHAPHSENFTMTMLFARIDAPFVAVPDPDSTIGVRDQLNKAFPKLYRFGAPGYRLVYQNSTWRLFARVDARLVSND